MLASDLADSPLASFRPNFEGDSDTLRDHLRERFAASAFGRIPASKQLAFEIIDRALDDAGAEEVSAQGNAAVDVKQLLINLLRLISEKDAGGLGMRAACFLRLLGEDDRSFQQLADAYGFTSRATPNNAYRRLQDATGLIGRGDKSPAAREACRRRRVGQRRERHAWQGRTAWNQARLVA